MRYRRVYQRNRVWAARNQPGWRKLSRGGRALHSGLERGIRDVWMVYGVRYERLLWRLFQPGDLGLRRKAPIFMQQYVDGKPVSDDASKVCILFDPKDGRVVHVHTATELHSQNTLTESEMEERARRYARHF